MDGGAWRATSTDRKELDTTEVTEHTHHIRLHLLPGKPGPSAEQPLPFNKLAGGDILAEGAGVGHVRSRA